MSWDGEQPEQHFISRAAHCAIATTPNSKTTDLRTSKYLHSPLHMAPRKPRAHTPSAKKPATSTRKRGLSSGRPPKKPSGWPLFLKASYVKFTRDLESRDSADIRSAPRGLNTYFGQAWTLAPQETRDYFNGLASEQAQQSSNSDDCGDDGGPVIGASSNGSALQVRDLEEEPEEGYMGVAGHNEVAGDQGSRSLSIRVPARRSTSVETLLSSSPLTELPDDFDGTLSLSARNDTRVGRVSPRSVTKPAPEADHVVAATRRTGTRRLGASYGAQPEPDLSTDLAPEDASQQNHGGVIHANLPRLTLSLGIRKGGTMSWSGDE